MSEGEKRVAPVPASKCPICGKPTVVKHRPFCSQRCANVDLSRWLSGSYATPVVADEDEAGGVPPNEEPYGEI